MTLQRILCCVLLLAGCAERQVDVDDELPELLPGCMVIWGRGYWEDGSSRPFANETTGAPSVCMCMTKDELNEGIWAEDLNELAYVECKRVEKLHDFAWSDCQGHYESGAWLQSVIPATDEQFESLNYTDIDCDGESDESCSITNQDQGDPMLALVFVVLLRLRRSQSARRTR